MSQNTPRVIALIPARLAATRLPNKPLIALAGRPMIQHVWERVRQAEGVDVAAVATPDAEIMRAVEGFGGQALLTLPSHRSGTDRLAEAATLLQLQPDDIVINIQGDEPLIDPAAISRVFAPLLAEPNLPMASLMCPCPRRIGRTRPASKSSVRETATRFIFPAPVCLFRAALNQAWKQCSTSGFMLTAAVFSPRSPNSPQRRWN